VAALTPKAEIEGEMGDTHVGLQARLMSQALRKLAGTLNRTDTICLFTNQLREKIGVMFGNPETTPGGRALKFYCSVRLDIRRIESLKDGGEVIGNRTRVKVVKNKCLAAGSRVFDPTTGLTHRIEDIVERGDRVARPRKVGGFGTEEPVSPDHARMLGYLIGDGYAGGKTPIAFINAQEELQQDAIAIAESLGCRVRRRGLETVFSHRPGEPN